jgi:hypothetical protein
MKMNTLMTGNMTLITGDAMMNLVLIAAIGFVLWAAFTGFGGG